MLHVKSTWECVFFLRLMNPSSTAVSQCSASSHDSNISWLAYEHLFSHFQMSQLTPKYCGKYSPEFCISLFFIQVRPGEGQDQKIRVMHADGLTHKYFNSTAIQSQTLAMHRRVTLNVKFSWTMYRYYRNIQYGLWCTKYQTEILLEKISQDN